MSESEVDQQRVPTYAELSRRISQLVSERDGEWCGLPMPLPGLGLVLEDRYPLKLREQAEAIQQIFDADHKDPETVRVRDTDIMGWREVNRWHGRTPHGFVGQIVILRHEDGRTRWGLDPDAPKRNRMLLGPMETFDAWHLETELTAIDRLATLLTARMFGCYVLTGGFLETSKRSGLTYFFRRCRPTVVFSPHGSRRFCFSDNDDDYDGIKILVCLCLHPLGYYANTFGGAMVPTDDVIAHLLLMRGDEAMLWRRANQHHPITPESGL